MCDIMLNQVKEFDFSIGGYCLHTLFLRTARFTSLEWFAKAAKIW